MTGQICTIVPPAPNADGITLVQGTKVVLQDGTELGFVTRIALIAEVGDAWRAEIHCRPKVGVMPGITATVSTGQASWWRRLLCRIAGVSLESTSVTSSAREWRQP